MQGPREKVCLSLSSSQFRERVGTDVEPGCGHSVVADYGEDVPGTGRRGNDIVSGPGTGVPGNLERVVVISAYCGQEAACSGHFARVL